MFDFDGTLSEIVARPEDARLDPRLLAPLERLRRTRGQIAVVSGRDRATLTGLLPDGWAALGSYGLELPPELAASGHPEGFAAGAARAALAAAEGELRALLAGAPPDAGVTPNAGATAGAGIATPLHAPPDATAPASPIAAARLEVKAWGVALHFRGSGAMPGPAALARVEDLARRRGLALHPGRLVWELRPAAAVDKGWAVRFLAQRLSPAALLCFGDDLGDLPAFAATRALATHAAGVPPPGSPAGAALPAAAIGVASAEVPAERLRAACDIVLPDRQALVKFCEALAGEG
ncbi:MAG TPA: trehalose-phosphatase [Candidatus Dormibacteraeota bacterium]|nr:trehalose-phosphatase [Candidatus Dormibacteraeota bacterium]